MQKPFYRFNISLTKTIERRKYIMEIALFVKASLSQQLLVSRNVMIAGWEHVGREYVKAKIRGDFYDNPSMIAVLRAFAEPKLWIFHLAKTTYERPELRFTECSEKQVTIIKRHVAVDPECFQLIMITNSEKTAGAFNVRIAVDVEKLQNNTLVVPHL